MAADDQLELQIRLPGAPVPIGEDVTVAIALVNRGSAPLLVNRRLLVAPRHTPEAFREVTFEVRGPPGYANRKSARVNAGRPAAEAFVELAPSDEVEKSFELTRLHSMHVPGRYAVRAVYANVVAPDALERRPWMGEINSAWGDVERV